MFRRNVVGATVVTDAAGRTYRLRLAVSGDRLLPIETPTPDSLDHLTIITDESLRYAEVVFATLKGREAASDTERDLILAAYTGLLRHPPEFLAGYHNFNRGHLHDMAVVYYLLTEAERLGIVEEVERHAISTEITWPCQDPTIDPPLNITRTCSANRPIVVSHNELKEWLLKLVTDYTFEQYREDAPLADAARPWLDRLLENHFTPVSVEPPSGETPPSMEDWSRLNKKAPQMLRKEQSKELQELFRSIPPFTE